MNNGVIGDNFLLGFALWRDSPHVFMHAHAWCYCFNENPTKQSLLLVAVYLRVV